MDFLVIYCICSSLPYFFSKWQSVSSQLLLSLSIFIASPPHQNFGSYFLVFIKFGVTPHRLYRDSLTLNRIQSNIYFKKSLAYCGITTCIFRNCLFSVNLKNWKRHYIERSIMIIVPFLTPNRLLKLQRTLSLNLYNIHELFFQTKLFCSEVIFATLTRTKPLTKSFLRKYFFSSRVTYLSMFIFN